MRHLEQCNRTAKESVQAHSTGTEAGRSARQMLFLLFTAGECYIGFSQLSEKKAGEVSDKHEMMTI